MARKKSLRLVGADFELMAPDNPLCGVPEMFGDGSMLLKLQSNRPAFCISDALPGYDVETIADWIEEAFSRWGQVADIKARRIKKLSDLKSGEYCVNVTVADLGTSGVLADQRLPHPGGFVLPMRINNRINWVPTNGQMQGRTIDPVRTLTHELGHFLGHHHFPQSAPKELMEPTILQDIIGPQPTEAKITADWFGAPVATPVPTPPGPEPKPTDPRGKISISIDFDTGNISIPGYRLTKLVQQSRSKVSSPKKRRAKAKKS
jgi:hypothetical protein